MLIFSEAYAIVGAVTKYSPRRVNTLTDSVIVAKGALILVFGHNMPGILPALSGQDYISDV